MSLIIADARLGVWKATDEGGPLAEVACALEDPRVKVYYDDGLRFLRGKKARYDLIIGNACAGPATG